MGTEYREKSELVTVDGQPEPLRTSSTSMDAGMADLLAASEGIDEAKLVRKLDWHLIPLIMSVYLFSFIDRVNVGNARLYKLETDLHLSSSQFQLVIALFYLSYMLGVPFNLVLKLVTPRRLIAAITVSWGLVATLMGLVDSYASLVACRVLLGAVEAGLFPGFNLYLTFFYTKHELALRVGYLFVSAAIAGALGGLLAYAIGQMDGVAGLSGWRWIFILEGIPSVLLGVLTYFALPNDAPTAWFLTDQEKALMELRRRRAYGNTASSDRLSREDVKRAVTDWRMWAFYVAQFAIDTMLFGFSTFLPTIIQSLGSWTTAQVQLLTIPCYFLGAAIYMATAYLSDRLQMRGLFCVIFGTISVAGYAVLLADVSTSAHYFACFLVVGGLYTVVGLPLAWLSNNTPRYGKKAVASGTQLTFGNAAGILSAFIYPKVDQPRYVRGHALCLGMVGLATAIFGFLWFWYWRENHRRENGFVRDRHRALDERQLAELGDDSPRFRYTL